MICFKKKKSAKLNSSQNQETRWWADDYLSRSFSTQKYFVRSTSHHLLQVKGANTESLDNLECHRRLLAWNPL